jgi:hypothetical protein
MSKEFNISVWKTVKVFCTHTLIENQKHIVNSFYTFLIEMATFDTFRRLPHPGRLIQVPEQHGQVAVRVCLRRVQLHVQVLHLRRAH